MIDYLNERDKEVLSQMISILPVDGVSRKDAIELLKESGIKKFHPAGALKAAEAQKYIRKEGDIIFPTIEQEPSEPEVPEYIKDMIWELAEHKRDIYERFPHVFGGIRSIEYEGTSMKIKNGKTSVFYKFLSKAGQEMVELVYLACKQDGIIK